MSLGTTYGAFFGAPASYDLSHLSLSKPSTRLCHLCVPQDLRPTLDSHPSQVAVPCFTFSILYIDLLLRVVVSFPISMLRTGVSLSHLGLDLSIDITLPTPHFCSLCWRIPQHGTVALVKGHGPVLLYQIDERDTRILIDIKNPLPADLMVRVQCLRTHTRPLLFLYI